jgi:hypothetical protein
MQGAHQLWTDYGEEYFFEVRKRKKKNNKVRIIHAPSPKLKVLQRRFADYFYNLKKKEFDANPQITGFLPGKCIADNAKPHLKKDWVVNMDIKDFFPSTDPFSINEEFKKLPKTKNWRYWFKKNKPTAFNKMSAKDLRNTMMICKKESFYELPQGSPASPVLANYIAIKEVDEIVKEVCGFMTLDNVDYTRYADDITVSFNGTTNDRQLAEDLVRQVTNRLHGPYKIKEQKTVIKHKSQRQMVTGVIVNGENPRIDRRLMNNMRAAIHNTNKKNEELSPEIRGMMSFIQSINKAQFNKLNDQIGDQKWKLQK